jgi:hypothetical protein
MDLAHEQFRLPGMPPDHHEDEEHDPERGQPPPGYYEGQEGRGAQTSLPGMDMTPQMHLDALSKAVGGRAVIETTSLHPDYSNTGTVHSLRVYHPGWVVSNLLWHGESGEILGVMSHHPGLASKMLTTAESLAREYPEQYSIPRHSGFRSPRGFEWSRRMMAERGEEVW